MYKAKTTVVAGIGAFALSTLLACSGNAVGPTFTSPAGGGSPLGSSSGSTTIMGTTGGAPLALLARPQTVTASADTSTNIQICINGTVDCTSVGEDGRFELHGDFSGDVSLTVLGPDGPIAEFTIFGVATGETIVVRVELEDASSHIEILSRSGGEDDSSTDDSAASSTDDTSTNDDSTDDESTDDSSTDDESTDDSSTDDESTDDESGHHGSEQEAESGSLL